MQIHSAEFIISAAKQAQFITRPIPHFVFAGRSNVGKSSILNKILNRKNLAKTSQTPGKTRLINYFLINDRFFFVDIPGYGFAKVSKKERADWGRLIEVYLTETPQIAMVFQLIDVRHDPSENDKQMLLWLQHQQLPFRILLTKADKLSKNKVYSQQARIAKILGVPRTDLIPTSAMSAMGVKETWREINQAYEDAKGLDNNRDEGAL